MYCMYFLLICLSFSLPNDSWRSNLKICNNFAYFQHFFRYVKGMLLGKFTPIFYSRIVIYSSHLNEQKKTHQKILIFHEVMPCQSLPIFQLIWNASKIFPRYMTSLEPNVRNYAYMSILSNVFALRVFAYPFPFGKLKYCFLR